MAWVMGFQRVSGLANIHGGLVPPMLFNTLSAVWFSAGLGNLCLNLNPEVQKIISVKFGKQKSYKKNFPAISLNVSNWLVSDPSSYNKYQQLCQQLVSK